MAQQGSWRVMLPPWCGCGLEYGAQKRMLVPGRAVRWAQQQPLRTHSIGILWKWRTTAVHAASILIRSPPVPSSNGIVLGLRCWPQSRTGRRKRRSCPQHRTHSPPAVLKCIEHLGAAGSMPTSCSMSSGSNCGTAAAPGSSGFLLRSARASMISQQCARHSCPQEQLSWHFSIGHGPYR